MNATLICILVYMAVTIYVSYLAAKRTKTESDYLIAGRKLGYGVTVFSVFATWFGAETCTGATGEVYTDGWRGARLDPFGYMICLLLYALVFAAPFWRKNITTLADLFKQRFSVGVEKLAAIILIPTSILWAAAQVGAFGHIISEASDGFINVQSGIAVAAIAVIIYSASGGILGDALNDVIQGVILIIGLYILAGVVMWQMYTAGTLESAFAVAHGPAEEAEPFFVSIEAWIVPIVGSVISQELVSRSMAAKSPKIARDAGLTASVLYLVVGLAPVTIGLLAQTALPGIEDSEQVLTAMAKTYLHGAFYVILIGALVSAILSTVDTALLACGGLLSHNLIIPMLDKPTEHLKLRISRWAVVGFGFGAFLLARSNDSVRDLVEQASSFGSAGIFTAIVFGLFTRFGGVKSAYASLIAGVAVYCTGTYFLDPEVKTPLTFLTETPFLCSVIAALTMYIAVALFEKVPAIEPTPVLQEATEEE